MYIDDDGMVHLIEVKSSINGATAARTPHGVDPQTRLNDWLNAYDENRFTPVDADSEAIMKQLSKLRELNNDYPLPVNGKWIRVEVPKGDSNVAQTVSAQPLQIIIQTYDTAKTGG